ncbi:N-acetylmuramidase domain-containing protein [Flavobacterium cerinum]|uniref:N-acetylmuramidase family protein n=1 Tax=Flavobacterium cerinum TaxID=2502784 RepID=A0ABY5ISN9_9FLAO|nr:N-acetylmuramidase family protein [Flavobacterium cerinum]UUC45290.1 N-acetylmuramidase family protein [Flavobacterium cerinum]
MKTIQLHVKAPEVITLTEMLLKMGYSVTVSNVFTTAVDEAVKSFQSQHNLVVDGIVGIKTWSRLFEKNSQLIQHNDKLLSEQDLIDFANEFQLELAAIKAVNEVESSGKGFLIDGRPKILFEGHIFWQELERRNLEPEQYTNPENQDILYKKWTKKYYLGGQKEYDRLQRAIRLVPGLNLTDAANAAASWGVFQIMGFNAIPIGYDSIDSFVGKMYLDEREHLFAFGRFLKKNNLVVLLQNNDWATFAYRYNGEGYKVNKYDEKLARAYQKYSA